MRQRAVCIAGYSRSSGVVAPVIDSPGQRQVGHMRIIGSIQVLKKLSCDIKTLIEFAINETLI